MWISNAWKDYELIDASDGERLERWGKYTLIRPDPQVIWHNDKKSPLWKKADASYRRSRTGGGAWSENKLPESWSISYRDLTFRIKPMGFKHTGLFPEQAANWDWFSELIRGAGRPIKVLNLFAYTGGATVAAAKAGASVCHVDAARGMVVAARENAALCGLQNAPIRYIVDDCKKFIERELRRGNHYDGIIMDPPSYGRGPTGEVWKLEENIDSFVAMTAGLFSGAPLFFLLNSYTTGLSASAMRYLVELHLSSRFGGKVEAEELGLPVTTTGMAIPCGSSVRCTFVH
ncbi:MAG: class I SAM-dependent methyltransferase [Clostridia bacterium]|nr:class I SAM-dependent methyltransferase [Clostridia bacterium]